LKKESKTIHTADVDTCTILAQRCC